MSEKGLSELEVQFVDELLSEYEASSGQVHRLDSYSRPLVYREQSCAWVDLDVGSDEGHDSDETAVELWQSCSHLEVQYIR